MSFNREFLVGIFVLIGLMAVAYLTVKLGRMEVIGNSGYELTAKFGSATGLKTGAAVEIAGVRVGRVKSITLDHERPRAVVTLSLNPGITLHDDVIASIKTSGLIGDKYVSLAPGGSGQVLGNHDEVTDTESAVDIEELISKYVFGKV